MDLCVVLSPTADLKDEAYAVGSQLKGKSKIPNEEGTILHRFQWADESDILLKATSDATVCIKKVIYSYMTDRRGT
jgi:hypothetical protein